MNDVHDFEYRCVMVVTTGLLDEIQGINNESEPSEEWNHYTFGEEIKERLADEDGVHRRCIEVSEDPESLKDSVYDSEEWTALINDRWEFHRCHRKLVRDYLHTPQFRALLYALFPIVTGVPDYAHRHLSSTELIESKRSYVRAIQPGATSNYRYHVSDERVTRSGRHGNPLGFVKDDLGRRQGNIVTEGLEHEWKNTIAGSCTPDMVELLASQWEDIPLVPLTLDDLPTQSGWIYLEKPLMLPCDPAVNKRMGERHTIDGAVEYTAACRPIRAMSWHVVCGPGVDDPALPRLRDSERPDHHSPLAVVLSLYADPRETGLIGEPADLPSEPLPYVETLGDWGGGSAHDFHFPFLDSVRSALKYLSILVGQSQVQQVGWSDFRAQGETYLVWDVLTFLDVDEVEAVRRHGEGFLFLIQAFHALWSAMQEIAEVETVPVQGKKRNKSGKERTVSNIIVVDLPKVYRPTSGRDPEFKGVLTYRFSVASHWRRIRDDSGTVVKRVRVKAHVKGPADAPFIHKNRVLRVDKPPVQEK